jgi:hypothetical protein
LEYYRAGWEHGSLPIGPFHNSVGNVVSGMKERVFYTDSLGTLRPTCIRKASELFDVVRTVATCIGDCSRATGEEFISTRTGSKRKIYEAARRDMSDNPTTLSELAKLGFFVKTESTVWNKLQVPRIISPRRPGYNYLLGRYLLHFEKPCYQALASLWGVDTVVSKGLTQEEKGALIADKLKPGWVCVGLDASRFDQTIGKELLTAEHEVYCQCYPGDRFLRELLKCQLDNSGRALCDDGMVKARIGAMRCSGDQNTSLGNCMISCMLAHLFCVEKGLLEVDCLNDGDDLLLFLPAVCLPKLDDLQDWYLQWGLRMKVEPPAYRPEQVEFCQSKPVWTPRGYVLVRNPTKALNTDFSGNGKLGDDNQYQVHLRSVGVCGLSMAAGIPILQSYYCWAIQHGRTGKNIESYNGIQYQGRIQQRAGHFARATDVDALTRESFALAFGIEAAQQINIEQGIADMPFSRRCDELNVIHPYFVENNLTLAD